MRPFFARRLLPLLAVALSCARPPQPARVATFDAEAGERHFRNLRRLTNGGENAEAYFSRDGRRLIFQSTRDGRACDQQFVMNVDGSCRPQMIADDSPGPFAALLGRMRERIGIGAVLNTSFNLHGTPLVCTPGEAIEVFVETGADALAIGPFLSTRS